MSLLLISFPSNRTDYIQSIVTVSPCEGKTDEIVRSKSARCVISVNYLSDHILLPVRFGTEISVIVFPHIRSSTSPVN